MTPARQPQHCNHECKRKNPVCLVDRGVWKTCKHDTRATHTSPPAPTRGELIDLSNAASIQEIIDNNREDAAKVAREQALTDAITAINNRLAANWTPNRSGLTKARVLIESLRAQQAGEP